MKVCGYCNNEYNDAEPKCPVCGSTLLRHNKTSNSAEAELVRIKDEIRKKRKTRSLIISIGAAVVLLSIIVAIICLVNYATDPQRDINKEAHEYYLQAEQLVDEGKYDEAIDILNRISPNWDNFYLVGDLRTAAVRNQLTSTLAGYESSGDYEMVIEYISNNVENIESDPEIKAIYDDSVAKYKESALKKADEYVSTGNYDAAKSILTTASRIIGEDYEINDKLLTVNRFEILSTATEYKNNGEYSSAIVYINERLEIVGTDSDILLVLSECENEYRKTVISKAASIYQSSGYQAALAEINAGLAVMPNDSELLSEQAAYQACEPMSLFALEAYSYNDYKPFYETNVKDILGNTYSTAMRGWTSMSDGGGSVAVYDIGAKYNKLTGTIIVSEDDKGDDGAATIQIYGDDILLYENSSITSDTKSFSVEIDISNVTDLKFVLCSSKSWMSDHVSAIICDVMLQKTR